MEDEEQKENSGKNILSKTKEKKKQSLTVLNSKEATKQVHYQFYYKF